MPYRRRRYPPGRRRFRRRRLRRRRRGGRLGRQLRTRGANNFLIKQKAVTELLLDDTFAYPHFESIQFSLNQIPQFTTLVRLFDNYKINMVSFNMQLMQVGDSLGTGNQQCQVSIARDYDGSIAPTTWNEMLERSDTRLYTIQSNTTRSMARRSLVPKIANTVFRPGGSTTGVTLLRGKQWVDSGTPDVPHNGLIVGINPYIAAAASTPGTTANIKFLITTTYYLSFKNTI